MAKKKTAQSVLTDWEWSTLVAAWRYYEHRHTIASSMFPCEMIDRYFGSKSKATDEDRLRIANQFVNVDHMTGPDSDIDGWPIKQGPFDDDARTWRKMWFFLDAVARPKFASVHAKGNGRDEWVECFRCDGKWIPKERYISNPYIDCRVPEEFVKEVKYA